MDLIDLPSSPKKTALQVVEETMAVNFKKNTKSANFLLCGVAVWNFYSKNYLAIGTFVGLIILLVPHQLTTLPISVGGPVHKQFESKFVSADENYYCNGQEWGLREEKQSTISYYASSTALGTGLQLDFEMNSNSPSLAVGRPSLYEFIAGEDGYEYISLKALSNGNLLELSNTGIFDGVRSRVRLKTNLSSNNLNTLTIDENWVDENKIQIRVHINDQEFTSELITLDSSMTYRSIYVSLIKNVSTKNNSSNPESVYMPLTGPCF